MDKLELSREEQISKVGKDVKSRLDRQFQQWESGLPYKTVFSDQSYKAKALNMTVRELAEALESAGYVKIFNTPSGASFVLPGDCAWTMNEVSDWLQAIEIKKDSEREAKRATKAASNG